MNTLAERLEDGSWVCHSCAHECRLREGERGVCGRRLVEGGELLYPHGRVSSLAVDPMEKKPLYHVLPGQGVLSFGGLGCNFRCPFCQNWSISQVGRDRDADGHDVPCDAGQLVQLALEHQCAGLAATYNEPLITTEWVAEVLEAGNAEGLCGCLVTNGYASKRALERLSPWVKAANVDLKCFSEQGYHLLGGRLEPVKNAIRTFHDRGVWVEVTTLVVPGFNEEPDELRQLTDFIASVSPDIPWHISAWHEDYQWHPGPGRTPLQALNTAYEAGREAGLRFVYTGNIAGDGSHEDTFCPVCGGLVIKRRGFRADSGRLRGGHCSHCGAAVPGIW